MRLSNTRTRSSHRELIAALGVAALAAIVAPIQAGARHSGKLPIVGFLGATTPTVWSAFLPPFLQRMRELGWVDGQNIAIQYRWAEGRDDRYAEFAAEFIRMKAAVIVTSGTGPVISVKNATS